MSMNNLNEKLSTLYKMGITPEKKKGALTQKEIDQAELIFCEMINQRPLGLQAGLKDYVFSHRFLQLFTCQNERRVQQLTMALGNAIGKKSRAEKADFAMAVQREASSFPHLRNIPGVEKMLNHLMMRSNETLAA
jgi:hypothetical protein